MLTFAIGMPSVPELLIVLVIVLVLFGAGRLPSVFKSFGEGLKAFRDAQKDGEDEQARDVSDSPKEIGSSVEEAHEVKEKVG